MCCVGIVFMWLWGVIYLFSCLFILFIDLHRDMDPNITAEECISNAETLDKVKQSL